MKTLRNYEVNGALLQADTGPEAQVGDQVRMYLDTTAHPGFPEYVVGTIQHPIQRVDCGSATNYSIEYNEDDLLGEAAQLIPDHVIDVVVVTAFEVLDAALQAEIAARIADVNAEEAARIAADTAEANARATADAAEQAARIAADALLVPKTTTVNGHALTGDITLTAIDLGFPVHADLAAANAVLPIGVVFYNTANSRYEVTTA